MQGNYEFRDMLRDNLKVLLEEKPNNFAICKLSKEVSLQQSYWQFTVPQGELAAVVDR